MDKPSVSIIICTYNRSAFLRHLIESIEREWTDRLDAELIVVDNNCTDDTAAVVQSFGGKSAPRRVLEANQGLSYARNGGAAAATKEYLLYLDDDATLTEGYLERLEIVLRRFKPDFFGGPVKPRFDRAVPDWFNPKSEIRQFETLSDFSKYGSVSGGNFGVRRSLVEKLGGFNVELGMKGVEMAFGEDRDMVERYRQATPPKQQRLYYAVELAIEHYTMPYKLDRKYQFKRKYENARAQEITFVRSGKRSGLHALALALAHVLYFPVVFLRLGVGKKFNPESRYLLIRHAYGVAGRLDGALRSIFRPKA